MRLRTPRPRPPPSRQNCRGRPDAAELRHRPRCPATDPAAPSSHPSPPIPASPTLHPEPPFPDQEHFRRSKTGDNTPVDLPDRL